MTGAIFYPSGLDRWQITDLSSYTEVQRVFLRADLLIAQPGNQIANTRRDELVGVENLDSVFRRHSGILSELGASVVEGRTICQIRKIPAAQREQNRGEKQAKQQKAKRLFSAAASRPVSLSPLTFSPREPVIGLDRERRSDGSIRRHGAILPSSWRGSDGAKPPLLPILANADPSDRKKRW
jgi:hypothetical protein